LGGWRRSRIAIYDRLALGDLEIKAGHVNVLCILDNKAALG
jgi:hypothetical protein